MENKNENRKTAIIIGAGPAGLTAAYRLLTETDIKPIVLEGSPYIGGISRTARSASARARASSGSGCASASVR